MIDKIALLTQDGPVRRQTNCSPSGFSVKAVCQQLGMGPHTLRAWETRYQAVSPRRTETGRRQYSVPQVERLAVILQLVNKGHSVRLVAGLPDHELRRRLRGALSDVDRAFPLAEFQCLVEELQNSLQHFDLDRVARVLNQRRVSLGARRFVLEVLSPVLGWMGRMVLDKSLTIAHEHAFSALVKDQIYQTLRYGSADTSPPRTTRFILATPEDDLHEFGIMLAAALLTHHEMPSHLLGANLPVEALASATRAIRGDVIILGHSPVPESERKMSFEEYLVRSHRLLPKSVAIWIGGAGKIPHLRRVIPGRPHRILHSLKDLDSLLERPAFRRKRTFSLK